MGDVGREGGWQAGRRMWGSWRKARRVSVLVVVVTQTIHSSLFDGFQWRAARRCYQHAARAKGGSPVGRLHCGMSMGMETPYARNLCCEASKDLELMPKQV